MEEAVALDVLIGVHVLRSDLRVVPEDELPIGAADAQVTTLAVIGSSIADLCDIGDALVGHPRRDPRVAGRPEIVGIGQEGVAEAALAEGVEQPRRLEGDVEVAVARWAPFEVRVIGPRHRSEIVRPELGLGALQEVQRQSVDRQLRMGGEPRQSLLSRPEGVHEDQGELNPVPRAEGKDLPGRDVEERQAIAYLQGRLRAGNAHRGPEPTVGLDDDGAFQHRCLGNVVRLQLGQMRDFVQGLDRPLWDQPGLVVLQCAIRVGEDGDGEVADARLPHTLGRRCQP